MWETWIPSPDREDLREEDMATHSSILAWRIPWTEEPGGLQSMGSQRVEHDRARSLFPARFGNWISVIGLLGIPGAWLRGAACGRPGDDA